VINKRGEKGGRKLERSKEEEMGDRDK